MIAIAVATLANTAMGLFPFLGPVLTTDVDTLQTGYVGYAVIGLCVMVSWTAAAVLFIIWLWRARKNLDSYAGMSAGWAIGGWFIPFANLVIPFRVVHAVASHSVTGRWVGPAVGVWWAAFVIDYLIARIAPEAPQSADLANHIAWFATAAVYGSISTVLVMVAGACLTVIVLRVSQAQDRLSDNRTPVWPPVVQQPA